MRRKLAPLGSERRRVRSLRGHPTARATRSSPTASASRRRRQVSTDLKYLAASPAGARHGTGAESRSISPPERREASWTASSFFLTDKESSSRSTLTGRPRLLLTA
jgi:hypothetical protein